MSDQPDFLEITKDKYTKTGYDGTDELIALALIAIAERLDKQNELLGRIAYAVEWRGIKKEQYKELYIKWEGAEPNSDDEIEMVHKMADLVLRECAR